MSERGRIRIEPGRKRVRAFLGGHVVADTDHPALVWEKPYYPTYYFPMSDVQAVLTENGRTERSPSRGHAVFFDVSTAGGDAKDGAYAHRESPIDQLRDLVALDWASMDAWYEEDERVYVHPRDPYKRVDVLPTSRNVRIEIDGAIIAESNAARILFETGLPPRYYLPATDVDPTLLRASETHTECPYKGVASYHHVEIDGTLHPDIVWYYPYPVEESARIAGMYCFYNEKVDISIEGERQERPKTIFG
jgi:uncharacterized protein (DUF427 family)